jgi:hypothetical protein
MNKRQFTFSENKLIFLDGGVPAQTAEVPQIQPQTTEAVPAQQEALKAPEKMPVSPDAPAQLNTQTKEAADKKFTASQNRLNILANITV